MNDTLSDEVREALDALYRFAAAEPIGTPADWDAFGLAAQNGCRVINAELLRLAGEVTELRAVCAATYQAAGCYGLPERFKNALSNAATGERIHDVDVDNLCPVDPVEWVERAEKAESELAALKTRIDGSRHAFLGPNMDRITFLAEDIGPVGKYALVKVEE